jgi:hypothetical protein
MPHTTRNIDPQLRWPASAPEPPRSAGRRSAVRPWIELLRRWRERNAQVAPKTATASRPRWPRIRGLRAGWILGIAGMATMVAVGVLGVVYLLATGFGEVAYGGY